MYTLAQSTGYSKDVRNDHVGYGRAAPGCGNYMRQESRMGKRGRQRGLETEAEWLEENYCRRGGYISVNESSELFYYSLAKCSCLTCYTCVNVSDNQMCNKWAIDTPCSSVGRDFCRSLHILDSHGNSVLVSKSCASSAECGPASVGCVPVDTQKICISCCDMSYCNVESPTNSTNAIYTRKRRGKSKNKRKKPGRNGSGSPTSYLSMNLSLTTLVASLLHAYHC